MYGCTGSLDRHLTDLTIILETIVRHTEISGEQKTGLEVNEVGIAIGHWDTFYHFLCVGREATWNCAAGVIQMSYRYSRVV